MNFILLIISILLSFFLINTNRVCIYNNFEKLYLTNSIDYNCIINYDFIDDNQIYLINVIKTKEFKKNFKEISEEERNNFLNYVLNNFKFYNKHRNLHAEYNSIEISKEILKRNMTLEELCKKDDIKKLNQTEINLLMEKKINMILNLPVKENEIYELYFEKTIANLFYSYDKQVDFNIEDDKIKKLYNIS